MRIITGDTARDVFKAYTCFIHVSFLFDVLLKRKVSCELIIPVTFLLSSPFCPDSFWHLYSSSQFFISLTVILTSLSSHSRTSYPLWQPSSQLCHLTEMTQVVIDSEDELHIHTCTTEVKKKKGGGFLQPCLAILRWKQQRVVILSCEVGVYLSPSLFIWSLLSVRVTFHPLHLEPFKYYSLTLLQSVLSLHFFRSGDWDWNTCPVTDVKDVH